MSLRLIITFILFILFFWGGEGFKVNPKKFETKLRTNSAGIPYTLLLRIEAIGFPTFGLLLQGIRVLGL